MADELIKTVGSFEIYRRDDRIAPVGFYVMKDGIAQTSPFQRLDWAEEYCRIHQRTVEVEVPEDHPTIRRVRLHFTEEGLIVKVDAPAHRLVAERLYLGHRVNINLVPEGELT